jgi:uncharacterized surface anchored protein
MNAMKKDSVSTSAEPKIREVIPTTEGNERSISPRVMTRVAEMAMIPKKGIVDMNARYNGNEVNANGFPTT